MAYAYSGTNLFKGMPFESFSTVAALYDEQVQIVTCNPELKTVADLKGKRVSIGAPNSGVYFNAIDILGVYGLSESDINPTYQSFGDTANDIRDGKIDAGFIVAGAPTPAITELCTTQGAQLLSLDADHIAALQEISAAYAETTIPAGTYEGIDADVTTVGMKATIVANDTVTEDEAYTIVKAIFEGKDEITEGHAKGAELDLAFASTCGIPYNAGAAKYFAEQGIEVETK
jgi:TRAP transporter TAXI family solute receptor